MRSVWGLFDASTLPRPPENNNNNSYINLCKFNFDLCKSNSRNTSLNNRNMKYTNESCQRVNSSIFSLIISIPRIIYFGDYLQCPSNSVCTRNTTRKNKNMLLLVLVITAHVIASSRLVDSTPACKLLRGSVAVRVAGSAQVVEAQVLTSGVSGPGNVYTASLTVIKLFKKYRGPGKLRRRTVFSMTLQKRQLQSCVVVGALEEGKRYFVFFDGPRRRNRAPEPVTDPLPYNKRTRRLIRQSVCRNCGESEKN